MMKHAHVLQLVTLVLLTILMAKYCSCGVVIPFWHLGCVLLQSMFLHISGLPVGSINGPVMRSHVLLALFCPWAFGLLAAHGHLVCFEAPLRPSAVECVGQLVTWLCLLFGR
jgi:hypothetical protein